LSLRKASDGREEELGLQTKQRRSRRCPATYITDLNFADDIAVKYDSTGTSTASASRRSAASVGLAMNAKKTKILAFNLKKQVEIAVISTSRFEVPGLNDEQHRG